MDGVVVDLGSGNDRRHPRFLNVDLLPYPEVDVVCEGDRLPFANDSIDVVVCIVVLEHVPNSRTVIREVTRVLRPGGRFYAVVPFLQPFHAAPHDYRRWTLPGLGEDLEELMVHEHGVYGGPASAMAWWLGESLAFALSFGSSRLRGWLSLPLQALFSPIKWLDVVAVHHPDAHRLASSIWVEARKPDSR
ncbi:MAG: class I SAM-dependent methyltransferase, partial [Planctomycetes bacterium]|nr:class I SAM-dependent methyltransferase [Planctomycetota bacterium]